MKLRAFACAALLVLLAVVSAVAVGSFTVSGRDLSDLSVRELYDLEDAVVETLHVAFERELADPESGEGVATYVVNTKTGKFHYPYCYSALQTGVNRRFLTASPADLVGKGYVPCGQCNPYPDH